MTALTSADGTVIAYESAGQGPAVVLVDGAMCFRHSGPMSPLADLLAKDFTVHTYDRRGRGESGDTLPYAVEREIEDLRALVAAAGGAAHVFAISSGVALTIAAASAGVRFTSLALYEPPFLTESGGGAQAKEYSVGLRELLDAGRRGDAAALFMTHVGVPAGVVDGMRAQPFWAGFEAIAPTLAYDDAVMGDSSVPRERAAAITVPTLLLDGGASPESLRAATRATAEAIPGARHRTLDGQTHDVAPEVLAPVLTAFFGETHHDRHNS
ncbi:pimeloyl-ACP methyl ester carboxylesterase [Allocatelliglobosispora scoriae]|uniref:Pimeloyl-ACP methyl ester carboxylesterase n=1 Tax=Allocatelliglobosispora scoriae TaxID=643052 RepID=A0A841C1A9_9ACTN|nr:alpha/beta hydrolase [Allocatelliglobosispora scoriae]MBB5873528.1 pimeloyl-ACP methyl ester carboxylesterase [Allocatelliglobosispora scoriae]